MRNRIARRAPILILFYPLLVLGVIAAFAADSTAQAKKSLTLFFIGNRSSEIEPCGCVKNQLGGVQYEATIYGGVDRESSIRVDAGAWTARAGGAGAVLAPDVSMKTRYALKAMGGFLDLDAVNVAQQDLVQGLEWFHDVEEKNPGSTKRLISANIYLKEKPEERAFKPYIVSERQIEGEKQRIGITGVTVDLPKAVRDRGMLVPADKEFVIADPAEELKKIVPELKEQADLIVALVAGSWQETVQIAQANPDLDVVVSTSRPPDFNQKVATFGKTQVVSVHNALGKELGRADLVPGAEGKWELAADPEWIGVSPKLDAAQQMVDLINDYKKNTEELVVERPRQVTTTYASAQYCASCHIKEYQSWQKTPHAHALQTLISKGSQYDPACLKCHTLGFQKDNGFYNWKQSQAMANVQCESCHGPAYQHANRENLIRNRSVDRLNPEERAKFFAEAKALVPPKEVAAATCQQCHQGDNDPHFNYDEKIHKVNHSDIDRSEAAATPGQPVHRISPAAARPLQPRQ